MPLDACEQPDGYVATAEDCDDADADSRPGLAEVCGDHADNDCDDSNNDCRLEGAEAIATSSRPQLTPDLGAPSPLWISEVAWIGDTNDDGIDDLVVTAPMAEGGNGAAFLVSGAWTGSVGLSVAAKAVWTSDDDDNSFGTGVSALGDIDGDGSADFAIAHPEASSVYIFSGGPTGTQQATDAIGLRTGEIVEAVGPGLAGGAELTGDSSVDAVVSSSERCDSAQTGRAWLLPGPLLAGSQEMVCGSGSPPASGT